MLLSDLFGSGGNGLLNNPQLMQALSGALMQAAQPSTQPQSMGGAIMEGMQGYQQQMQMKQLQDLLKQKQAQSGYQDKPAYPFSQAATVNSPNSSNPNAFNIFPEDKQERLAMLKEQAQKAFPDNPTMQQVSIAQAIHESGLMGKPSQLAQQGNLFGIKAPGTAGTVSMGTQEFASGVPYRTNAAFGANASPSDSFNQYAGLMNKDRYGAVRQAQSPLEAFQALQKAGYATDPEYSRKLSRVYNQYVAPMYM